MLLALLMIGASLATELTVQAIGEPLVVYVDGVETGTTPLDGVELPEGEHIIAAKIKQSSVKRLEADLVVSGQGQTFVEFNWQRQTAKAFLTDDASTGSGTGAGSLSLIQLQHASPVQEVWLLPSDGDPLALRASPTLVPAGAYRCVVRTALGETEWPLVLRAGSYEFLDVREWLPSRLVIEKIPVQSTLELRTGGAVLWTGEGSGAEQILDPVVGVSSTRTVIPNLAGGTYTITVRSGLLGTWQDDIALEPGVELEHTFDWREAENFSVLEDAYAAHRALVRESGLERTKTRAVLSTLGTGIAAGVAAALVVRGSTFKHEADDLTDRYERQLESDEIAEAIETYDEIAVSQRAARRSWAGAGVVAIPTGVGVWISFRGWRRVRQAGPAVPPWDPYTVIPGAHAPPRVEGE